MQILHVPKQDLKQIFAVFFKEVVFLSLQFLRCFLMALTLMKIYLRLRMH